MHKDKIAQSSLQGFSSVRSALTATNSQQVLGGKWETEKQCTLRAEHSDSRAGGGKAIMKGAGYDIVKYGNSGRED